MVQGLRQEHHPQPNQFREMRSSSAWKVTNDMKNTSRHDHLDELIRLTQRLDQQSSSIKVVTRNKAWAGEANDGNQVACQDTGATRLYQYFEDEPGKASAEAGVIPLCVPSGSHPDPHHKLSLDLEMEMRRLSVAQWGLFSWRLHEQTGLKVATIRAVADRKAGYDAYVLHTDSTAECLSESPWIDGEHEIGGYLKLISKLSDQLGIDLGDLKAMRPRSSFLYGNHVIGTAKFWRLYNAFVSKANGELIANLGVDSLSSDQWPAARGGVDIGKLVMAYQKRLISLFVAGEGKGLKVLKISPIGEKSAHREWLDIAGYLRDQHMSERSQHTRGYWLTVRDFCRHQWPSASEEN